MTLEGVHFCRYHGDLCLGQAVLDSRPFWTSTADAESFALNQHCWPGLNQTDPQAAKKSGMGGGGKKKTTTEKWKCRAKTSEVFARPLFLSLVSFDRNNTDKHKYD